MENKLELIPDTEVMTEKEEVTEVKIKTEEEIEKELENQMESLHDAMTSMNAESIMNLDESKKDKIADDVKATMLSVFKGVKEKVELRKGNVVKVSEIMIQAGELGAKIAKGEADVSELEKLFEAQADLINTVLGKGSAEIYLGSLCSELNVLDYEPTVNLKWKTDAVMKALKNKRKGRGSTYEYIYDVKAAVAKFETFVNNQKNAIEISSAPAIDINAFVEFMNSKIDIIESTFSNVKIYNAFKKKVNIFLHKKVSGSREAALWHANFKNNYIGTLAGICKAAYLKYAADDEIRDTGDVDTVAIMTAIGSLRFVIDAFSDNNTPHVVREKLLNGIFVVNPEIDSVRYSICRGYLVLMDAKWEKFRRDNNIPTGLEEQE